MKIMNNLKCKGKSCNWLSICFRENFPDRNFTHCIRLETGVLKYMEDN